MSASVVEHAVSARDRRGWRNYLGLLKTRIAEMVVVATTIGYFAAAGNLRPVVTFLATMIGTGAIGLGAGVLNNWLEADIDGRMERTRNRPLPAGTIDRWAAATFGLLLVLVGAVVLALMVNWLAMGLGLLAAALYVGIYTPLKRHTWWNTPVGAIPGAIPPLIGWVAATGQLDPAAWTLFGLLFVWQHPHFYAIAWMCRDDYRRGGLRMLSGFDDNGAALVTHVVVTLMMLIPISLLPTVIGLSGWVFGIGVIVAGAWFSAVGLRFARRRQVSDARALLKSSVIYLPVVLVLFVLDSLLRVAA